MAANAPSFFKPLFWCLVATFFIYVLKTLPYVGKIVTEMAPPLFAIMFSFLAYDFLFDEYSDSRAHLFRYFAVHLILVFTSFFVMEYMSAIIITKHRTQNATYTQGVKSIDKYLDRKIGHDGITGYALWQLKREILPRNVKAAIHESFVKGNDGVIDAILKYIPHRIVSFFSIKEWAGSVFWAWYYIATLVIGIIGGFFYKESVS